MNSKPNIIISLPLVWSFRNFLLSGITDALSDKYTIYYAVDENNYKLLEAYVGSKENLLKIKRGRNYTLLLAVLRKSFLLLNKELEYISDIMKEGKIIRADKSFKKKIKNTFVQLAAQIIVFLHMYKWSENIYYMLCGKDINVELENDLENINPAYILSTAFVIATEWPLFFLAAKKKIPIYTHVLSFDNITSRGYLPIRKFDKYFVWNEKMKSELEHYFQINPEKVIITGTPQFDFHNSFYYKRSKAETMNMFGLLPGDRFLLYCANHVFHTPDEPTLIESILSTLQQDTDLRSLKIIVRLHPLDNYERWRDVIDKNKEKLILSIPWSHPIKDNSAIGLVTIEDMVKFVNLLRYAEVVLNIASTISIDAAITNTPIICIGYHPTNKKESACYHNYHFSEHYKLVMQIGTIPLATNHTELKELIKREINNREHFCRERDQLATYYFPEYKKSSSDRLIKILLND